MCVDIDILISRPEITTTNITDPRMPVRMIYGPQNASYKFMLVGNKAGSFVWASPGPRTSPPSVNITDIKNQT